MYQLVYYYRETVDNRRNEYKKYNGSYSGTEFRLRRNALHYLLEIVQSEYREEGFGTEQIVGGINCYKSEKIENGGRKIIEITIKVEKVGQ